MINDRLHWWRRTERDRDETQPLRDPSDRAHAEHASPSAPPKPEKTDEPALRIPDTTLGRLLDQTADRFGDAPALVYGGVRWTYRELKTDVNRLAGGMASLGVRRGDRVMLTLPNCPEFVLSFFAVQKLGAVVVNAGPLMGADDLSVIKGMTQPKLVVALDLLAPRLKSISENDPDLQWLWTSLRSYQKVWGRVGYRAKLWQAHRRNGHLGQDEHLRHLLAQAPPRPPSVAPSPDDVALLQPTGGTTGRLKVAQLSHRNLLANAMQLTASTRPVMGQERFLGILPMFHVYGLTTCLVTPVFNAGTILPVTRFSVSRLLDVIARQRPSIIALAPAIIEPICDELEHHKHADVLDAMRAGLVTSGAAPLTPATAERFRGLTGANIVQGYGLTEASPVTHANPVDTPRDGSIGFPLPGTHIRIADLDDPQRDAKPGTPGELLVRGPQIMAGYLNDPEETAHALRKDAKKRTWLHTGDVAYVDGDGYTFIIDRRKDMINRSGLKVYPEKVERMLKRHPRIADAAVVGRVDPVKTETVVAVVVTRGHVEDFSALTDELRADCRKHLAPYEVPECFEFVEELPRTALGKLQRSRLQNKEQTDQPATTAASKSAEPEPANGSNPRPEDA